MIKVSTFSWLAGIQTTQSPKKHSNKRRSSSKIHFKVIYFMNIYFKVSSWNSWDLATFMLANPATNNVAPSTQPRPWTQDALLQERMDTSPNWGAGSFSRIQPPNLWKGGYGCGNWSYVGCNFFWYYNFSSEFDWLWCIMNDISQVYLLNFNKCNILILKNTRSNHFSSCHVAIKP